MPLDFWDLKKIFLRSFTELFTLFLTEKVRLEVYIDK